MNERLHIKRLEFDAYGNVIGIELHNEQSVTPKQIADFIHKYDLAVEKLSEAKSEDADGRVSR